MSFKNWKDDTVVQSIRDRFVTGDWSKAAQRAKAPEAGGNDDDVYGDFEDIEMGEEDSGTQKEDDATINERKFKKLALRAKFDAQYPFPICNVVFTYSLLSGSHNSYTQFLGGDIKRVFNHPLLPLIRIICLY